MTNNFDETVKKLTEFLKTEANTETVVGQAFELGEFHCVPVIKFGIGLGYGGGEGHGDIANGKGKGEGGGNGAIGGTGVNPIGFLVSRADQISFISTRNSTGIGAAFEKVPELIDKLMEKKSKSKAEPVAV